MTTAEHSVDLEEGRIAYRTLGTAGPPVVLLHGGGLDNSSLTWKDLARNLAADHRVFAPDLPKHGRSRPWNGTGTQRALEDVLDRLLDHWGLGSATLVGLSLGATVSLGYALREPGRVERIVAASAGGIQDRAALHPLAYLSLRDPVVRMMTRFYSPASLRRYVRRSMSFATDVSVQEVEELVEGIVAEFEGKRDGFMFCDWNRREIAPFRMRTNHLPHLGRIACPTLFVHGRHDDVVPLRWAQRAARRVPGSRLEVVEGVGHLAPMEDPRGVTSVVRGFLDRTHPA